MARATVDMLVAVVGAIGRVAGRALSASAAAIAQGLRVVTRASVRVIRILERAIARGWGGVASTFRAIGSAVAGAWRESIAPAIGRAATVIAIAVAAVVVAPYRLARAAATRLRELLTRPLPAPIRVVIAAVRTAASDARRAVGRVRADTWAAMKDAGDRLRRSVTDARDRVRSSIAATRERVGAIIAEARGDVRRMRGLGPSAEGHPVDHARPVPGQPSHDQAPRAGARAPATVAVFAEPPVEPVAERVLAGADATPAERVRS
jgi:hypothetical protein